MKAFHCWLEQNPLKISLTFACSGGVESDSLSKLLVHSALRGLVVNSAVMVRANTSFRPVHIFHVKLLALSTI